MNNIKIFLNYLQKSISLSFLYSQALCDQVLRDHIHSLLNGLQSNFKSLDGRINTKELNELKSFFQLNKKSRGGKPASITEVAELEYIPFIIHEIIANNKIEISKYLGQSVLYENPIIWRNFHFNPVFSGYDIYSNVWHQDSHDGNRLLKIFVLLDNVEEKDGPLHYMNECSTKKNWEKLRERWGFHVFDRVQIFQEELKMIGPPGYYLIIDTSRCMHRDDIPESSRDMLQITLYPSWRKNRDRHPYEL